MFKQKTWRSRLAGEYQIPAGVFDHRLCWSNLILKRSLSAPFLNYEWLWKYRLQNLVVAILLSNSFYFSFVAIFIKIPNGSLLVFQYAAGVGHGPRDQFCPITSLQMADWFFHLCAGSLFDFLRFSPFIKWFTIIFFGKVWVDRCSKPQFLKQYNVCLFSIDIVLCNSSCA